MTMAERIDNSVLSGMAKFALHQLLAGGRKIRCGCGHGPGSSGVLTVIFYPERRDRLVAEINESGIATASARTDTVEFDDPKAIRYFLTIKPL